MGVLGAKVMDVPWLYKGMDFPSGRE